MRRSRRTSTSSHQPRSFDGRRFDTAELRNARGVHDEGVIPAQHEQAPEVVVGVVEELQRVGVAAICVVASGAATAGRGARPVRSRAGDPGRCDGGGVTGLVEAVARPAGAALAAVTGTVARVRRGRPMHARGVLLRATLVVAEDEAGAAVVPQGRTPATVRVSLGAGAPRGWPDVVGVAVRWTDDGALQDVLFSSSGRGRLTRWAMLLRREPMGGWFSTLMPLRSPHGPRVLALRPDRDAARARGVPVLEVLEATPLGQWHRFGALELHGPEQAEHDGDDLRVRFDPTRRAPRRLGTYAWEDALRDPAYAAARRHGRP